MASFPIELFLVRKMLVLAAAAGGEVRALWLDAVGRRSENLDEVGVGAVRFVPPDFGADFFARKGEGDEDDPAIGFGYAGAEVGEGDDFEFNNLVPFVGFRFEFAGAFLSHDLT